MKQVHAVLVFFSLFNLHGFLFGVEIGSAKSEEDKRMDTVRYGTETEIAALIQTLKGENAELMDKNLEAELIAVSQNTRNQNILTGLLGFFADRTKSGLEDRALRAIEERDDEAHPTVLAAINYLGKVNAVEAVPHLEALLDANEERYMDAAFRALGRAAKGNAASDQTADYLIDFFSNRNPPDQNRREIVIAIGETGSKAGIELLSDIAGNPDERPAVRTAAVEALSKIGDETGLNPILGTLSAEDPNLRSSAVAALGPFSGKAVDDAILESFRDSYYRTRIAASKASGERQLAAAVPYLRYRAEYDEVPTVKDEAIKALGAINNADSKAVLDDLFSNRKISDRVRMLSAEMLISNDAGMYAERVIAEMEDAQKRNQKALYSGFLKAVSAAKTGKVEDLARRFLNTGGVIEKSYALDMTLTNEFRTLAPEIRLLLDDKNGSLARKAKATLEKLGMPAS
ncbi:MAG: HEAT repeat domain-containing protein [Spirochaetaceae bacterium]|jgi:HEAT repeat protein|nr:HEAT repeat domain-containing protein [Spirochaetaceae bacterium]